MKTSIVEVNSENIGEHPGVICFINPKTDSYNLKIEWLEKQFINGLKIKLLYLEGEKSPKGFIEYVPGEYCWRAVDAKGYMFIHCIWTNGKKYQHLGLGKTLIEEVEKDAADKLGVAVMTSDGPFMANKTIFLKNGYKIADESGNDQLLYKPFREGPPPAFRIRISPENNTGLALSYSRQCPWVARFIEELDPVPELGKQGLIINEIKTFKKAQDAPSHYSVFNLMHNGRILADRYISKTRFLNILKKDIK